MKKSSIVISISFLSFIMVVVALINTYKINKGYAEYHSAAVRNDTSHFIASFEDNDRIFKAILNEGTLSQEQLAQVRENVYVQVRYYEDYHGLAVHLDRYQHDAYSIASAAFLTEAVFNRQQGQLEIKTRMDVDDTFVKKVEMLVLFNSNCIKELHRRTQHLELNEEGSAEISITDDFWIDILRGLNRLSYEKQSDLQMLLN
ncbi:hypothetical protein FIU87_05000 [Bacillus sp. THAF10]|uniref:hypothetical protein n=1 Tax=Bacillus sp. THAF10 TaxID=2587848 RepID=UPI001268232B|nr:hypothetical protein [Bacillus sp. THAF10]QFT88008.1 hypothetical protein FIU87_05000 [Bacillus sp. THAF10]